MRCVKCGGIVSIRVKDHYVSHKCDCEITVIYPDKTIKVISKKEQQSMKGKNFEKRK